MRASWEVIDLAYREREARHIASGAPSKGNHIICELCGTSSIAPVGACRVHCTMDGRRTAMFWGEPLSMAGIIVACERADVRVIYAPVDPPNMAVIYLNIDRDSAIVDAYWPA